MKPDMLRIDPAVDVIVQDNGVIRFLTPTGELPMTDPFGMVRQVAGQCRDGATDAALADACGNESERSAVADLVGILTRRRVLTRSEPDSSHLPVRDVLTDWMRHYGGTAQTALPTISIAGSGHLANALRAKLADEGFALKDADGDCCVAVSDHAEMDWLREMNLRAFTERRPFLPVWMDRACINWGPMVLPGATGCLECRWHREQANARFAHAAPATGETRRSASACLADLAAVMVSGELLRWALGAYVETEAGMAWRFDFLSTDLSGAQVMRLPRCPTCGGQS